MKKLNLLSCLFRKKRKKKPVKAASSATDYPLDRAATDQLLYDRCCRYMVEKKPFLVEGFSIRDLSYAIMANKSYLSRTINRYAGKNFRQYVNYYRIMYAMEVYRQNMGLRVIDLMELSGFHNMNSFQESFRRVMGMSPGMWCAITRRKSMKKK